jgi:GNAT superfamily N-acetyltransferase
VTCDVVSIPSFNLFFNRHSTSEYISYARPSEPFDEDPAAAIAAVREAFESRSRTARWEWIDDLYPALAPALGRAGIAADVTPLMVVTPEEFQSLTAEGIELRRLTPDEDLRPFVMAQRRAYQLEDEEPSEAEYGWIRSWMDRGGTLLAAMHEGVPVAGGAHLPIAGVTEVAGIGTVPEMRGRGIGGAVTAALVQDAFDRGCDRVFLTAGDETACRVYRRVGFRQVANGMAAMAGVRGNEGENEGE